MLGQQRPVKEEGDDGGEREANRALLLENDGAATSDGIGVNGDGGVGGEIGNGLSINGDGVAGDQGGDVPDMIRYKPGPACRTITVFKGRSIHSGMKAYIRQPTLITVFERSMDGDLEAGATSQTGFEWWYVAFNNVYGWVGLTKEERASDCFELVQSMRRHEMWPGNGSFYCDGRIMLGSDEQFLKFSVAMILVPLVVFLATVPWKLGTVAAIVIYTVASALLIICFYNLFRAATMDPGIIPRNPPHVIARLPEGEEVSVYGWRYCETCNIYRPPRAKHCSSCDNCVLEFDHHCPWVGSCVAKRNYRYFYRFVVSVTLLCILGFVCSVLLIAEAMRDDDDEADVFSAVVNNAGAAIVILFTFFALWSVLSLCVYHTYLVSKNMTTNEHLRGVYSHSDNPTDDGCCSNWVKHFTEPVAPSHLKDQSEVLPAHFAAAPTEATLRELEARRIRAQEEAERAREQSRQETERIPEQQHPIAYYNHPQHEQQSQQPQPYHLHDVQQQQQQQQQPDPHQQRTTSRASLGSVLSTQTGILRGKERTGSDRRSVSGVSLEDLSVHESMDGGTMTGPHDIGDGMDDDDEDDDNDSNNDGGPSSGSALLNS